MRVLIPHTAIITESGEVTRASLDELIRRGLDASSAKPCAIELFDATTQRILFLRDRQIYAAADVTAGQITATNVRDFLTGSTRMNFPAAVLYAHCRARATTRRRPRF